MKRIHLLSLALLLSLGIYWFYNNFENVSVTYEVGLQGKARRYPFLAAHTLLRRMGIHVEESSTVPKTFIPQNTVVLIHEDIPLNQEQCDCIKSLHAWVLIGGNLIIASSDLTHLTQSIFSISPVHLRKNQLSSRQQNILTTLRFGNTDLRIFFDPRSSLTESSLPNDFKKLRSVSSQIGIHLLVYSVGRGTVTILSDAQFLRNTEIGNHDHAQSLWHLINLSRPVKEILWIYLKEKERAPSLATLLWQYMYPVIISVLILLLNGLWYASGRFGPLLPPPFPARRRLFEHVQASGHFLWQQGQSKVLLHQARQALLKRLGSSHPEWLHFSPEQLSQRLAQISGLSAAEIQESLSPSTIECSPTSFTRMINILAQLRKIL